MALIGYCGEKTSPFLGNQNVKRIYVVAPILISEDIWKLGIPIDYMTILSTYGSFYAEERNESINAIIAEIQTLEKDDLVLFQCEYGQSRSYAAASVMAKVLGLDKLTRIYLYDGHVKRSDNSELDSSLLAESMYDSLCAHNLAHTS